MVVGAQINKVLADLTNTTDGLAKATDGLATMTATLVENMREHFDLARPTHTCACTHKLPAGL